MITVVILTHNHAQNLTKLLPTLRWATEVLIIDDISTDNTAAIAKKYNARLVSRPLNNDFAAQRNFALSQVKTPWTFFLDPDESISTALAEEIKTIIANPSYDGYALKRQDNFLGVKLKHGETANLWFTRLGQTQAGTWVRPVHETWNIKNRGYLTNLLHHSSHASLESFLTKINWYSTIDATYRHQQSQKISIITVVVYPCGKFIVNYFGKLGFLDGFPGLIMAYMMALHSLSTRIKLHEMNHAPRSTFATESE